MTNGSSKKTYSISYRTINTSDVLDITFKKTDIAAETEAEALNSLRASVISEGGKNIRVNKVYCHNPVEVSSPKKKKTVWGWIAIGIFIIGSIAKLLQKMT